MGTKYSANSVSGYNATPPADDGTVSEANKVKWSTIKTKLPDPLKTTIEAIDSDLQTHFDIGPVALISNTTLGATHHNQVIDVSGAAVTLTLTDAASLTAGWYTKVVNTDSSNSVTIGRATGADTINGTAANFTLPAGHAIQIEVNAAADGFLLRSLVINPVTTDTAQTISGVKTHDAVLNVGTDTTQRVLGINGPAASSRNITFQTAGVSRWIFEEEATAESGSNAGSNFNVLRRTDAGAGLGTLLTARRSDGAVQAGDSPTGGFVAADTWNFKVNPQVNNVEIFADSSVTRAKLKAVTGTHTFSAVGIDTTVSTDVTHGLGTDNLDIFIIYLTGSINQNVAAVALNASDIITPQFIGATASAVVAFTLTRPAAGDIRIFARNDHSGVQDITVRFTFLPRD